VSPNTNEHNTLCNLPEELVENIAEFLDAKTLCMLRLSCKKLYQKTVHHFGYTVLDTVVMDFSPYSLQRLVKLSEDSRLRKYPVRLIVSWTPGLWLGAWKKKFSVYLLDVKSLRDTLLLLVNCRSFEVRLQDVWEFPIYYPGPSDAIKILIEIIAETGIPVKSFSVCCDNLDQERLPVPFSEEPAFNSGWAHVENLRFDLCLKGIVAEWVLRLIILAPKLKRLTLGFRYELVANGILNRLVSAASVSGLQEITLLKAWAIRSDVLLAFLRCSSSTLRYLSLEHLQLINGTWVVILTRLRDEFPILDNVTLSWLSTGPKKVLHFPTLAGPLTNNPQGMGYLKLSQMWFQGQRKNVKVEYRGSHTRVFLDTLLRSAGDGDA
jgi:hypothetical protein